MEDHDTAMPNILEGAEAIAEFLFGDRKRARSVYHYARTAQLPVFRLGSNICARPSRLEAWIKDQEDAATSTKTEVA